MIGAMENFDVVQALVRTALGNSPEAVAQQVERLAERLTEDGDIGSARKLRTLLTRSKSRQAVEPLNLQPSAVGSPQTSLQKLGARTAVPVDRESGAPLGEVLLPSHPRALPVLPPQAQAAYDSLLSEWKHERELAQHGLTISRSLLIFGPPGTGKTNLALAVAAHLGTPAVVARLDGLISSLLGSTARNLGLLFDFCNRFDCVLVLDEFDAVAKIRDDSNEVGEIKRVVNALLQNLDKRANFGLTIAVTNHEKLLDSAIWRRFEHQVRLGLPAFEGRTQIAYQNLQQHENAETLAKAIAQVGDKLSGSDIRTLSASFLKASVLTQDPDMAPVSLLRRVALATGMHGLNQIKQSDIALAGQLNSPPASLTQSELAGFFKKDRKTISRWLMPAEASK